MNNSEKSEQPMGGPELLHGVASEAIRNVASRSAVLRGVEQDIASGVSIIVITGDNGSGKTAVFQNLQTCGFGDHLTIFFEEPVTSFSDVIRRIGDSVQVELPELNRDGRVQALDAIARRVEDQRSQLLLACNGAEQIYLATLEQIRRMLDKLNEHGVFMQLALIGGDGLLESMEQLKICNFAEVKETRYRLEPLTQEETRDYIFNSTRNLTTMERDLFTQVSIRDIFDRSGGNLQKIDEFVSALLQGDELPPVDRKDTERRGLKLPKLKNPLSLDKLPELRNPISLEKLPQIKSPLDLRKIQQHRHSLIDNIRKISWSGRPLYVAGGGLLACVLVFIFFIGVVKDKDEVTTPENGTSISAAPQTAAPVETPDKAQAVPPDPAASESTGEDESVAGGEAGRQQEEVDVAEREETIEELPRVTAAENDQVEHIVVQLFPEEEKKSLPGQEEEGRVAQDTVVEPDLTEEQVAGEPVADQEIQQQPPVEEDVAAIELQIAPQIEQQVEPEPQTDAEPVVLRPEKVKTIVDQVPLAPAAQDETSSIIISSLTDANQSTIPLLRGEEQPEPPAPAVEDAAPAEPVVITPSALKVIVGDVVRENIDEPEEVAQEIVEPLKEVPELEPPVLAASGETSPLSDLYSRRLDAGKRWQDGRAASKYTIQLMRLTSADARAEMDKLLNDRGYLAQAEKLYIFESSSNPPAVFVFYGEYDSMTEARRARNSVPQVFKKYKPYVLSVPGAMRRVR